MSNRPDRPADDRDDEPADDLDEPTEPTAADEADAATDDEPTAEDAANGDEPADGDEPAEDEDDEPADQDAAARDDEPAEDDAAASDEELTEEKEPADGDEPAEDEDDEPADQDAAARDDEPAEDDAASDDDEPAEDDAAASDEELTEEEEPADGDEPAEDEDDEPADQVAAASESAERPSRGQRRGAHARKVTPRERLRELIAPQANRTQALIAVACLILGFALSVQAKSTSQESSFSSLRQSELVGLLDRLNKRQEDLRKEVTRLEQEKAALESDDSQTARKAAQERQHTLAILAGTEPATGPGIELVVSDPDRGVTASDLLNAVQELRDAGAEVLQIGNVRLAVDSYFTDGKDGVLLDGKQLEAPYRIKAIGDPHTLATAMDIPGGVLETLHRAGADGTVTKSQSVAVTAVRKS
ncbi:MAG: DUF881 domain-containing protein [Streptosporangiales bacterium]|nr:DUF881 domain-containing protein [Streptosporangiales bacterium]